jgi:hypothetical protein
MLESVFYHSGFDARCHALTGLLLRTGGAELGR